MAPDGFERPMQVINGQYPGPVRANQRFAEIYSPELDY